MVRLLNPQLECPECGLPLEHTGATYGAGAAAGAEEWRPEIHCQTIACDRGHAFEAIYEGREPWRSVLAAFGVRIDELDRPAQG